MENNSKSHGGLDIAGKQRSGLRDPDMERIIRLFRNEFMRCHAHQNVGGFDADHDIIVAELLDNGNLLQRALNERLRGHAAVFLQKIFFQGTAVHAHTDRDPVLLRLIHDSFYALPRPDIARVDPDLIRSALDRSDGKAVIKVDICDERDMDLFLDLADRSRSLHRRDCHADDIASGFLEAVDLLHRCRDVLCLRVAHGLDQDRISPSDLSVPYLNYSCMISKHTFLSQFQKL